MYKSIISGRAAQCRKATKNTESSRKVNLILLSAQLKFLNFSANRSNRETIKSEKMIVIMDKTIG